MTFGLISWLKQKFPDLTYEVPVWYPASNQPDVREWIVSNGLGGYASSTLSGAHRRRYHGLLVSALRPPRDRHLILSRIDEMITVDGQEIDLSTNQWASGVVSPTGYKRIESFTTLPSPTWVFSIGKHYLVKQLALLWGTNELHVGYYWMPNPENQPHSVKLTLRVLTAFRSFHGQMRGSSEFHYPQFVSPKGSVVRLSEADRRLCLSWTEGDYEPMRQWWWDYAWPEETARGERDREDLLLVGKLTSDLQQDSPLMIGAALDRPVEELDVNRTINKNLKRQRKIMEKSALRQSVNTALLLTAADQFVVYSAPESDEATIFAGYPWFCDYGRYALIALPGLTLSAHRYDDARKILSTLASKMRNGLLPVRFLEASGEPEYEAADVTLWWAWALYHYVKSSRDLDFAAQQLPLLKEAARHYIAGTNDGIRAASDGLLICSRANHAFTWMDAKVADYPITPRSGKPVEIAALWYNFLETILYLSEAVSQLDSLTEELHSLSEKCKASMQKFWDADEQYLYDVIETGQAHKDDNSLRPNQLLSVSLPFRALEKHQEKAILRAVDAFLLTPYGLRTLAPGDESYQGQYGCGLAHADQYHRDLSYYQGTAWPWLMGVYCDALVNVFGNLPEAASKISILLQPLLETLTTDDALGTISEIFDAEKPHQSRGCLAHACAVAEVLRWYKWAQRHSS